jgi:multiple sugar transport system permease protein
MVLFLSGLAQIPRDYSEAARIDGAGPRANLPVHNHAPARTDIFLRIHHKHNELVQSVQRGICPGGEYPHESIYMLQHFMNNNLQNLNYQRVFRASVYVFIVILLLVLLLYLRRRREGDYHL